jgi:hypothetical protein
MNVFFSPVCRAFTTDAYCSVNATTNKKTKHVSSHGNCKSNNYAGNLHKDYSTLNEYELDANDEM